ncbi:LacI family DNA-binding transcriptional regulator [Actinopolyspora mortivallis]|uniref:LacI family transcriptional regulator n=1 Tax=Actinopolyspora mortivallis TaxID=33906 RepID=A0A2T0GX95_ACTMO|nr:LacI family DNA-binding transcriptional regulator [Actinopolyspora mortivallis]PRW63643.1 LacI family transcriptional regulator [Actinopolyspora mortivallis]
MVSIADVARDAGVSSSTVSYVLSGKRSISPETRRRVEDSVRRLGYHPHAGARALASSRTNVLGLVMPLRPDIDVPVLMGFVTSVVTSARRYQHDVLLVTNDEGPEGLRRVANSATADALLVMDVETADPRVPVLHSLPCPAVLVGLPDDPGSLSCVDLDFSAAARRCVEHLAELGHERIALVGPSPAVYERGTSFADRFLDGFTTAARQRNTHAVSSPCPPSYEGVCACLDRIFAERPEPTGLVVHNEAVLGTLLSELRGRGRRVPEDVSVVAVGPGETTANWPVPLTTVPLPSDEIGRTAVEMTMRELEGTASAEVRLLSPRLVPGRSTAPPPPTVS